MPEPDFGKMKAAQVFARVRDKDPAATAYMAKVVGGAFERLRKPPVQDAIAKMTATSRVYDISRRQLTAQSAADRAVRDFVSTIPSPVGETMERFPTDMSKIALELRSPLDGLEEERREAMAAMAEAARQRIERERRIVEGVEASAVALRELEERVRRAEDRSREAEAREREAEARQREAEERARRDRRIGLGLAAVGAVSGLAPLVINVL